MKAGIDEFVFASRSGVVVVTGNSNDFDFGAITALEERHNMTMQYHTIEAIRSPAKHEMPWDQRLARRLARVLAHTPVHPNAVTTAGLLLCLASAAMFATGDPLLANWAAPMFMAGAFTDHVDGELARMTGKTSEFGHHYDRVAMVIGNISLFAGMGIGLRHGPLGDWAMVMGTAAGLGVVIIFLARSGAEKRLGAEIVRPDVFAGFEVEDTLYIIGPIAWIGALTPFLIAAAVGAPLFMALTLFQLRRGRSVTSAWWR